MTPRRRYLVALTHDLHVRNFVASTCVERLARRGGEVHLLVPRVLLESVRAALPDGLVARVDPVEPYAPGPCRTFLRRHWRIGSFVSREGFKTYRHKIRLASGSWSFALQVALFRVLARRIDIEAAWRRAEAWLLPPRRAARALLEQVRPDVVFAPTLIHDGREVELVKAARRLGIPTVGFAASWDTLTSKGGFAASPDWLLTWGDEARQHAITHHGFSAARVVPTGAPQLDVYADDRPGEPRARFLARRAIPPDKRIVLFAGTTVTYWEDEPGHLRALSDAIEEGVLKDYVVWYRPHPRRPLHELPDVNRLPHVVLDDQMARHKTARLASYSPRRDDLLHYRGLLDAADVVVTAFSTMIVEAALLGKPSLVIGFGLDVANAGRLIQHAEYEHSLHVLATPGVTLCRSLDQLIGELQRVSAGDYEGQIAALRARAAGIARNHDGRAAERIVAALESIAGGGDPGA